MKDKLRLQHLKTLLNVDEMQAPLALFPRIEEEWCSFHNILQSSLHQISEICMFQFNLELCALAKVCI